MRVGTLDLSIDTLRAGYLDGSLTPSALVERLVARLDESDDPAVWISRFPDDQLGAAAAVLEQDGSPNEQPLYGIPIGVKDNIDVAGLPTTAGCAAYAYSPTDDAAVVQSLRRAGALIVGKTNLDQFATGLSGMRSPYGTPRNPIDERYVPGGSSSGSAVAVATHLVTAALATDTAGSGRVPAALTGTVGLKPTPGVLSNRGVVPACRSLDCVSVIAASVPDARAVLAAMTEVVPPTPGDVSHSRVGVPELSQELVDGDRQTLDAFERFTKELTDRSIEVVEVDLRPFLEVGELLYRGPWVAERLASHGAFIAAHRDAVLPVVREVIERGLDYSAADVFAAMNQLDDLRDEIAPTWESIDALMVPTVPTVFTLEQMAELPIERNFTLGRFSHFANLLRLPAAAVPAGERGDGLPFGVTLFGPPNRDVALFDLAASVTEQAA